MTRVYKYELSAHGFTTVSLPVSAEVLTVAFQENDHAPMLDRVKLVLWALVDPGERHQPRSFYSAVTGEDIPIFEEGGVKRIYRATAQLSTGNLRQLLYVVHVFEVQT